MLAEIFMLRLETAMRAAKEPAVKEAVANARGRPKLRFQNDSGLPQGPADASGAS